MARRPRADAAHRHADGSPMKPARSRPVSRCPDLETNANGTYETLARTVRRAFADLGERIPDDLHIYTPPGVHHAGDEVILEGMTDAIPGLRIDPSYGQGTSPKTDETVRRILLLMQRNSLRRAAFRRHLGREPGDAEPAWSMLHHPLLLALGILAGDGPRPSRPGLDMVTGARRIDMGGEKTVSFIQRELTGGSARPDVPVEIAVWQRLPETVLDAIRNAPGMRLAEVIDLPACGIASVDAAVAGLAITSVGTGMSGNVVLHLERTRFIHDPRIPADVDMGPWLDHLTRHPPIH